MWITNKKILNSKSKIYTFSFIPPPHTHNHKILSGKVNIEMLWKLRKLHSTFTQSILSITFIFTSWDEGDVVYWVLLVNRLMGLLKRLIQLLFKNLLLLQNISITILLLLPFICSIFALHLDIHLYVSLTEK